MGQHTYDGTGKENLRANQQIFGPSAHATPSMSGGDVGGTEDLGSHVVIKQGPKDHSTPKGSSNIPAETFNDRSV